MKRINAIITALLAVAAVGAWAYTTRDAYQRYTVPTAYLALSITLTVVACYGWLMTWLAGRRQQEDAETRCRKCGHILRGLSEPRCPECGEKI